MDTIPLDVVLHHDEFYIRPFIECRCHFWAGALTFHIDVLNRLEKCVDRAIYSFAS